MSLRNVATDDLNKILATDFGIDIELTNPTGEKLTTIGYTTDVGAEIDPETGQLVSARISSIAISLRELKNVGFDIPIGIESELSKPWLASFSDTDENVYIYKILSSHPDRALGIVTCNLELYK